MRNYPPQDEQDICVSCGFCCNDTLFEHALLGKDEKVEGHFEESRFQIDNVDHFKLPCPHFCGKCTIYDDPKPNVCESFRCNLLKSVEAEETEKSNALEIVANAKHLKQEIIEMGSAFFPNEKKSFQEISQYANSEKNDTIEFKIFQAKVNIFNILLLRYFKTDTKYDELINKESTND